MISICKLITWADRRKWIVWNKRHRGYMVFFIKQHNRITIKMEKMDSTFRGESTKTCRRKGDKVWEFLLEFCFEWLGNEEDWGGGGE